MSKTVSRTKYEDIKYKAQKWLEESERLKEIIENLEYNNQELKDEIDELKENIPDKNLIDELESEIQSLKKTIKHLSKNKKLLEATNREKIYKIEREMLLKDSKIQRLEEAKKELKDRYNELRDDYREEQRWLRQKQ